jgi:hypothetical protein
VAVTGILFAFSVDLKRPEPDWSADPREDA